MSYRKRGLTIETVRFKRTEDDVEFEYGFSLNDGEELYDLNGNMVFDVYDIDRSAVLCPDHLEFCVKPGPNGMTIILSQREVDESSVVKMSMFSSNGKTPRKERFYDKPYKLMDERGLIVDNNGLVGAFGREGTPRREYIRELLLPLSKEYPQVFQLHEEAEFVDFKTTGVGLCALFRTNIASKPVEYDVIAARPHQAIPVHFAYLGTQLVDGEPVKYYWRRHDYLDGLEGQS